MFTDSTDMYGDYAAMVNHTRSQDMNRYPSATAYGISRNPYKRLALAQVVKDPLKHHKFEILDDVLNNFFSTNNRTIDGNKTRYNLKSILQMRVKTKMAFHHDGDRWLATVFFREDEYGPSVHIKLPNDGFEYIHKKGRQISRQSSSGWIKLGWDRMLKYMPKVKSLMQDETCWTQIGMFYEHEEERVDIKLLSNDVNKCPNLVITYESGLPADDAGVLYDINGKMITV